jgi:hypothetical protein
MDVWFCRQDGTLYYATARHDEPPTRAPYRAKPSVRANDILKRMVEKGYKIDTVGICPPDMLGLE